MDKITLSNSCPFDLESVKEHEVAYNRLDHNKFSWFNTWFPINGTGGNKKISEEMEQISEFFTEEFLKNGLCDINRLFQTGILEKTNDPTEGNLYCVGDYCFYWIRLINRAKDYNLYIHCYNQKGTK